MDCAFNRDQPNDAAYRFPALLLARHRHEWGLPLPDDGNSGGLARSFPNNDGPAGSLLVANRLDAHEGLSRDFQYTIEILSDNPDLALKDLMGKMVTVELVRDDGKVRYFNGYVFDFRFLKHDAGFAHYQMTLRPWLAFLRQRRNNCIFHGKTLEEQTHHILDAYPMHDWQTRQLGPDAPMSDAV